MSGAVAGRSARLHLMAVIAAAVIPVALFAAYLLIQYALTERGRYKSDAMQVAEQVSVPVESYLANLLTIIGGLSKSNALAEHDYATFYREASRWVAGTPRIISVRDALHEVVSTAVAPGAPLPAAREPSATEKERLAQGRPVVSGAFHNDPTKDVRIAVSIPLEGNFVLQISAPTSEILEALKPAVDAEWTVGVGDRSGNYVSRSQLHDKVTGTPGLPEYIEKVVGRSGTFVASNFQSETLLAGYYRSPFSDWFYTANIPLSVVQAPMWRSISAIGLIAVFALGLSSALAYFVGNSLATAAAGLARQAQALGRGQAIEGLSTSVQEFAVISSALQEAQEALAKRTGEIQAVLETAPAAIWVTYDPQARLVIRNRFAAELMGLDEGPQKHFGAPDEVVETVALKSGKPVPREDRPLSRAMRGELIDNQEYTYIVANGVERVLLSSARPIRDPNGAIIGAVQVSLDISERKKAWQQRQLLVNELNHRVKNSLAVVQSIASQTLRNAPDLQTASRSLSSRLVSLSKAHDILTRENWSGADLTNLVNGALEPHAGQTRYKAIGDPVWVPPSLVLPLSLALHELATNAVKYGALSNATGTVTVSWTAEGSPLRLRMEWREEGGPGVKESSRKGFGTRLLEGVFENRSSSRVTLEFRPTGLVCTIETEAALPEADTPAGP